MKTETPKMTLAPVFYTLAQVQFNPIAQMSDYYVASLQERLRRTGFPDYREEQQVSLTIRLTDESQPDFHPTHQKRWSFMNSQRTEGYLLRSDVLVFHTTAYNTFTDFLDKTISGLSLVNEIVELDYTEKIGLRYLDAIVPNDNETLQQYLNLSLLGFFPNLRGKLNHNFTEMFAAIDSGNLVARAVIMDGALALSPDLAPLQLVLQDRFTTIKGQNAVLDTDYFIPQRDSFNIEKIKDQFLKAHEIVKNVFETSVTNYAREKWA